MTKAILPILLLSALCGRSQNIDALYIAGNVPVKLSTGSSLYVAGNVILDRTTPADISIDNDGLWELTGNLTVNGMTGALNITAGSASSSGTFLFKTASNSQQINCIGGASLTGNSSLSHLQFNNTSLSPEIVISGGDVAVEQASNLILTSGRIRLGDQNLIHLNPSPSSFTVSAPGINALFITDGTGVFSKHLAINSAPDYIIPLGAISGEYTPLTLKTLNATYAADAFLDFSVKNIAHPCINMLAGNAFLNRYWRMEANNLSGITYDAKMQYLTADVSGIEANMIAFKYSPSYSGSCLAHNWSTTNAPVDPIAHEVHFDGMNAFSDFTAGNLNALPVTFGAVSARADNCQVYISFETLSEENNKHFEVELSTDGNTWNPIVLLEPKTDQGFPKLYQYLHTTHHLSGMLYYRIKQTDHDGRFMYSKVVSVRSACDSNRSVITAAPNPVTDLLKISGLNGVGQIRIVDAVGRVMRSITTSRETEYINTVSLSKGLYYVEVVKNGKSIARFKIIKRND